MTRSRSKRKFEDDSTCVNKGQRQTNGRDDGRPSCETTTKESASCAVEEKESKVPSLWDRAVAAELERYAKCVPGTGTTDDVYRPTKSGRVTKVQLRKAAEEFVRRCNEDNEEDLSFVLVS